MVPGQGRICDEADVLYIGLLDHIIVGDEHRYFSFREAGNLSFEGYGKD